MIIVHPIGDLLLELFTSVKDVNDRNALKLEMEKYYTFGPYKPKVTLEDNNVIVEIDTLTINSQDSKFREVTSLCEKGEFIQAKAKLSKLLVLSPHVSEYHRVLAQILLEEGKFEDSINSLIDALKWDPKNHWALLLMGNIFSKHKDDFETARKYYD